MIMDHDHWELHHGSEFQIYYIIGRSINRVELGAEEIKWEYRDFFFLLDMYIDNRSSMSPHSSACSGTNSSANNPQWLWSFHLGSSSRDEYRHVQDIYFT